MIINNLEYYRDIFENMPEGIMILDANFQVIDVNKSFENFIGYTKQELLGKYSSELTILDKDNCAVCKSNKNSAYIPEELVHTAEIQNKNGSRIPVRISHKNPDGYHILSISPLSNIACLSQAHVDFVSTVSHELRTPLTSIKGFADTLLSAGSKLDAEQQKRFISIIKSQVDRLTRLVENLLTVSRLESKKDKSIYKAVNFKDFLDFVLQNIAPKSKEHNIRVEIMPNLPPVWADSDKLEQIMTNLIDNAIKYSNKGTSITVKAGFAPDNSDFVEVKVIDQGVGIPEQYLPKIFTKFSRIDNPLTRQTEGTGLGLYITKSLVESMGGKIFADSNGKGSTFTVWLSVATPEKHAAEKFLEKS